MGAREGRDLAALSADGAFEAETTNQVVLLVVPSLEGDSLEDFSIRVAEAWKVGQKGRDNGVIFLVAVEDRKARIEVDGGMPQHGHGLPTRPQVTRELPGGGYLIEGMKFSMSGWWEVKLAIEGPAGADRVTFNTVVAEPGARR